MGSNRTGGISQGPNSNVFLRKIRRKKETLLIQIVSNSVPIWNIWFVVQWAVLGVKRKQCSLNFYAF
jgi:hypothetical protein